MLGPGCVPYADNIPEAIPTPPGEHIEPKSGGGANQAGGVFATYGLRVVGHSMGAGLAFIVTLLLQSRYPHVKCFGFGVPGALANASLCQASAEWMTSVVLDDDLISRLGVGALNHLRDQVLDCISRSKCNKTYIMQTLFKDFPVSQFLYSPDEAPQSQFRDSVTMFMRYMKQKNATELREQEGPIVKIWPYQDVFCIS